MRHPDGLVTWADLNSPDVDASIAFYSALFGWETQDQFDEASGIRVYVHFMQDGKKVVGLGGRQPGQMEGVPALWTTYVNVADIDATAAAFTEHGGAAFMPEPMQVMDAGRMFYGADPTGAAIGMWEPGQHEGADEFNTPGFMTWNELSTRDLDAAVDFYKAVFPWTVHTMEGAPDRYQIFMVGDRPTGGAMEMSADVPEEVPANWMIYFTVADADAFAAKVPTVGGTVVMEPFDTGVGRVAVASDPHGGVFAVIKPTPTEDE